MMKGGNPALQDLHPSVFRFDWELLSIHNLSPGGCGKQKGPDDQMIIRSFFLSGVSVLLPACPGEFWLAGTGLA